MVAFTQAFTLQSIASTNTSVTIDTIANQTAGAGFQVTGQLTGFAAPPTLLLTADDGGAFVAPSFLSTTATTFSFVHTGLAQGSYTVKVRA